MKGFNVVPMTLPKYYITTPIYYVNDRAHLGNAYTIIMADMLARFYRLDGYDVRFMTGTDEHGLKVEQSARQAGLAPQDFVDQVSQKFRDLCPILDATPDVFMRTTENRHKQAAQTLWRTLEEKGHIYKSVYAGWYALRDEAFYSEKELVQGRAPSGAQVEWVEEPSYFFRLSAWQEPLLQFYREHPAFMVPESRRNEIIRFVEGGLQDLCISRSSFNWGVPLPQDADHIMYVWMDALTVYLTALGYPDHFDDSAQALWQASHHLMGKDISRFHAVYWPAFLMAAGLPPPRRIFAHGWWTNEGEKMSKSLSNTVDPVKLIEDFGSDALRYFMVREVPFGQDGNFSYTNFIARTNADLANDFGNLCQRTLSFVYKNAAAQVPTASALLKEDTHLLIQAQEMLGKLRDFAAEQALSKMCATLWTVVAAANRYIDSQQPWALRKTDPARMATVLYVLLEVLRHLGILSQPFIPKAAAKLLDQLGVSKDQRQHQDLIDHPLQPGTALPEPQGLFPRIQQEF